MVDSIPILDFFPFNMNLILFPKSSLICVGSTALTFEDRFALGAAKGYSKLLKRNLVIEWFGNLTANVFFLFVTYFDICDFFF